MEETPTKDSAQDLEKIPPWEMTQEQTEEYWKQKEKEAYAWRMELGGYEENVLEGWDIQYATTLKRMFFTTMPQTVEYLLKPLVEAMEEEKALRVIADYDPQDLNVRLRYFFKGGTKSETQPTGTDR